MYKVIDPQPIDFVDISFWKIMHVSGKGIGLVNPRKPDGEFIPFPKGQTHNGVTVVKRGKLWYWVRHAYYNHSDPLKHVKDNLAPLGVLTPRQMSLVANCINYSHNDPGGLPAHNLLQLVGQLYALLAPALAHLSEEQRKSVVDQYHNNMKEGGQ